MFNWLPGGPREAWGMAGHGQPPRSAICCYISPLTFKMLFDPRMLSLIFHNDPELHKFCAIVSAKWTLIYDAQQKTIILTPDWLEMGVCGGNRYTEYYATTLPVPTLYTARHWYVHCAQSEEWLREWKIRMIQLRQGLASMYFVLDRFITFFVNMIKQ